MKNTLTVGGLKKYVSSRKRWLSGRGPRAPYLLDRNERAIARYVLSDIVRPDVITLQNLSLIERRVHIAESIIMSEEEAQ